MGLPELAQAVQHRSQQRHVTVLATLGLADVNAALRSVNIANAKTASPPAVRRHRSIEGSLGIAAHRPPSGADALPPGSARSAASGGRDSARNNPPRSCLVQQRRWSCPAPRLMPRAAHRHYPSARRHAARHAPPVAHLVLVGPRCPKML
jgi:hypothetical protein